MQTYMKMKFHLERHMYKRGKFKGDAPADPHHRSKSNFRVQTAGTDAMAVVYHNTRIITAKTDGTILIDSGGWFTSTTKARIIEASRRFMSRGVALGTVSYKGLRQQALYVNGKAYRFDTRFLMQEDGTPLSTLQPFEGSRVNREKSAALRAELHASEFWLMLPILYGTAEKPTWRYHLHIRMSNILESPEKWGAIVHSFMTTDCTLKDVQQRITAALTISMGCYETYDTETFSINP